MGDDTFNAPLVDDPLNTGAVVQTLNNLDELDGNGGTNTLNATLLDDADTPEMSNIQNFFFRSRADDAEVSLAATDSAEQVWSARSTNNLEVTNIQNAVTIGLRQITAGTEQDFQYADDALGSDEAVQALVLDRVGTANTAAELDIETGGNDAIIAIDAMVLGVNNVLLSMDGSSANTLEALTLMGSGSLELAGNSAGVFDALVSIDAGELAGSLELTLGAAAVDGDAGFTFVGAQGGNEIDFSDLANFTSLDGDSEAVSLVGGDGDDIFTMGDTLADVDENADFTLDGGAGFNTLIVSADLGTNDDQRKALAENISNFQLLAVEDNDVNLRHFSFDEVSLFDAGGGITVTNLAAGTVLNLGYDEVNFSDIGTDEDLTIDNLNIAALKTLTLTNNVAASGVGILQVIDADGDESLATLNIEAGKNLFIESYTTRDGDLDPEATPADREFTLNVSGEGDVTFGTLTQGGDLERMFINNNGEGDLTIEALDLVEEVAVNLDGAGDIAIDSLDVTNAAAGDGIVIRVLGDGDRVIEDINNTSGSEDIRIRGDNDLTIGEFDDGEPTATGYVTLEDGTTLDASTFMGDLISAFTREDTEAVTFKVGVGDYQFWLDDDGSDGTDNGEFTFVFSEDGIGSVTIVEFMTETTDDGAGQNSDVLDFSSLIDGTVDAASVNALTGTAVGESGVIKSLVGVELVDVLTVTLVSLEGPANVADGVVITSADGSFDGSVTLVGVTDLSDFVAANFDFVG